jgi:hypothetical protein
VSDRRKPSPVEAWAAIDAMASQQELDRIKALSEADLDRELAALGIDPAAARSVGQSALEAAAREAGLGTLAETSPAPHAIGPAGPAPPGVIVARPRRTGRWIALAAAASLAAAVAIVARMNETAPVSSPHPDVAPDAAVGSFDAGDGRR